jgi:serine/threonine protein kinase
MDDVFAFYSEQGACVPELAVGSVVCDTSSDISYELLELLGSGSYAQVFLARDLKNDRDVALKCLSKRYLTVSQLDLQYEEVTIHKSLGSHPHVVTLHGSFETDDWLFLVLEYCGPVDLYTFITDDVANSNSAAQFEKLRSIFRQMLEAVVYCHRQGVFHRDLKPENFMVIENGKSVTVKLTDFGLATTEDYCDDFECGSKPYMSYECRNGYDLSHYSSAKSDVWALGIIFLNLFYCRCPWDDPDAVDNPVFSAFVEDSGKFLADQFGCSPDAAEFLASAVFCDESHRCDVAGLEAFCKLLKFHDVYVDMFPTRRTRNATSIASLIPKMAKPYLTIYNGSFSDYHIHMPAPVDIAGSYPSPPISPNGSVQMPDLSWSEMDDDEDDDWAFSFPSFACPLPTDPKSGHVTIEHDNVRVSPFA